jgi:hypothetical protein
VDDRRALSWVIVINPNALRSQDAPEAYRVEKTVMIGTANLKAHRDQHDHKKGGAVT